MFMYNFCIMYNIASYIFAGDSIAQRCNLIKQRQAKTLTKTLHPCICDQGFRALFGEREPLGSKNIISFGYKKRHMMRVGLLVPCHHAVATGTSKGAFRL